ncbi:MAG: hypothetical protein WD601_04570, partial [Pseudohongiellaceae bacterium]
GFTVNNDVTTGQINGLSLQLYTTEENLSTGRTNVYTNTPQNNIVPLPQRIVFQRYLFVRQMVIMIMVMPLSRPLVMARLMSVTMAMSLVVIMLFFIVIGISGAVSVALVVHVTLRNKV